MRRSREEFLRRLHDECPHHVDLIQPSDGFCEHTNEAIFEFLDARIGAMDMYLQSQDGLAFTRYCFLKEDDANEFRARFAGVGKTINFPKAACG